MNRLVRMILRNLWQLPGAYTKLCHYAKHTNDYPELEKYQHIQYIMKRAIRAGNVDLDVHGLENIPKENGFLMYSNHQGLFDVVAIAATCDAPIATVLKKELKNFPLIKQVIACTNSFPMDREDVRQSMGVVQSVINEVSAGRNYVIFPEGTRSKSGNQMGEFHSGSFRCASKTKCPIIPIALIDSFRVLDQKGSKRVKVQIHYLPPIYYDEYKDLKTVEIATLVKTRIAEVVNA